MLRSSLNNWNNGNMSELSRNELILLARFFENQTDGIEEEIEEDNEE